MNYDDLQKYAIKKKKIIFMDLLPLNENINSRVGDDRMMIKSATVNDCGRLVGVITQRCYLN